MLTKQMDTDAEMLTVLEAAAYLRICKKTIYRWINAGKIPFLQAAPGGDIRIVKSDLIAALETSKRQGTDQ